jgi:hypothetical protein
MATVVDFAALRGTYAAGVASAVDADLLAERIAVASSAIQAQRDSIVEDAEAGALRVLPERLLP